MTDGEFLNHQVSYLKAPGSPDLLTPLSRIDATKENTFRNLHWNHLPRLPEDNWDFLPLICHKRKVKKSFEQHRTLKESSVIHIQSMSHLVQNTKTN